MIKAEIIADSKNEFGNRITTFVVTFPRIILAEFNTHRVFSRNSASSRAIPFNKMVESIQNNPFIPIAWQKDHKGMQGTEYENDPFNIAIYEARWMNGLHHAVECATRLYKDGAVTKQICNRLLEPFAYHTAIVTATEWNNFFTLRCPKYEIGVNEQTDENGDDVYVTFKSKKDAIEALNINNIKGNPDEFWRGANAGQGEIHIMDLAEKMWDAMNESKPKLLKAGEWHIPFGDSSLDLLAEEEDRLDGTLERIKIKIATARCARVSYTVVGEEGKAANYENDIKLHDRLLHSGHMSPFEHCAQAMNEDQYNFFKLEQSQWSGNFRGFKQYRKLIE